MPDGRNPSCKVCVRERSTTQRASACRKKWVKSNAAERKAKQKAKYHADPGTLERRAARLARKETATDRYNAARRIKAKAAAATRPTRPTREPIAAEVKAEKYRAQKRKRQQKRPWVTHERRIKKVGWVQWDQFATARLEARRLTALTGVQHDVDHLYPINGSKTISGLHTPDNLQVITHKENLCKGGRLPGNLSHELWDPEGADVYHRGAPDRYAEAVLRVLDGEAAARVSRAMGVGVDALRSRVRDARQDQSHHPKPNFTL